MRWRDISTYRPVDPGIVLLTDESDVYVSAYSSGGFDNATHWMPLPPLPGEEGGELVWEDGVARTTRDHQYVALSNRLDVVDRFLGTHIHVPTPNQAAAMQLAQDISDAIWRAQGEKK
jgi:hypothetical protein